jgi:hypothetical protein
MMLKSTYSAQIFRLRVLSACPNHVASVGDSTGRPISTVSTDLNNLNAGQRLSVTVLRYPYRYLPKIPTATSQLATLVFGVWLCWSRSRRLELLCSEVSRFPFNINETFKNIRINNRLVHGSRKCNAELSLGYVTLKYASFTLYT